MTPLEVMIALHYHVSPVDYAFDDDRHRNSVPVRSAIEQFLELGLLVENTDGQLPKYIATDGMVAYVKKLCSVPLPRKVWSCD